MMPLSQTRLLIRADGGPLVGTGHVMRMLALGQAYQRRGGQVTFVVGDLPLSLLRRLEQEKFQVFRIRNHQGGSADAIDTREIVALVQPHWVALDGYKYDENYQRPFANSEAKLLVMDDYQHASHHHANLVVNQNIYSSPDDYAALPNTKVLAGPDFAMLRSEFHDFDASRKIVSQAKRILVTFGGADPDNWTLRTLQILSDLKKKRLVVDCVVGNCYGSFPELDEFKRHANMTLRIHKNVDRMSLLMQRADLAITGGGSTCYELARCGVPSIVTSIADNQVPVARTLDARGAMRSIDCVSPLSKDRSRNLVTLVRQLINDSARRREMSETASRLVDGRGAFRIVDRMAGSLMVLRPAVPEDAKMLWRWRNDPEVRAVSFSPSVIDLPTHENWISRRIADPCSKLWVALNRKQEPIGNVRFQLDSATDQATISLVVDQRHRCRGIGTALINAAVDKLYQTTSAKEVLAQIKAGNAASERAFQNAGFKAIEPVVIQGAMALQYTLPRGRYRWSRATRQSAA